MKKSSKKPTLHAGILQLLDKLDQIHESVNSLDKKVDLLAQSTKYELKSIRVLDEEQNTLLAQHAQRSEELSRANDLLEKNMINADAGLSVRIESLEQPRKVVITLFKWAIAGCTGVASIAGLAYAILKLWGV